MTINWSIEPFRSGGFINKDYDMGRVYVDLPIIEAKRVCSKLNSGHLDLIEATRIIRELVDLCNDEIADPIDCGQIQWAESFLNK